MIDDINKIDSIELKRILTAEFEKAGLHIADIDSLIVDNRRIQDGRKAIKKRHAPILKHTKVGRFYYYDYHDVQEYIDAMIDYHDKPLALPYMRITNMTAQEYLDEFQEILSCVELEDGTILHAGIMFDKPTVVVTTASNKLYILKTKGEEKEQQWGVNNAS